MKAGLEIHQQLATKEKLFCHCPTSFAEEEPVGEVTRRLRAVTGETGEVDAASLSEAAKARIFTYRPYPQESCLVELDSEPPTQVNSEALDIVLEIALMLNCTIPHELHVMRKNVIDGSNTSGFQRTVLVGVNGTLDTSFGKVGILSVALEEESAQILSKSPPVYGLNRLGLPLVEIATAPDITTPEQGRELAEKLGMILRSTRVRRGLGTIRQDLNVSTQGGERVEIKGVQDLKNIPTLISTEVARQEALLKTKKPVQKEVRKALPDGTTEFLRPMPGSARLYPETDCFPISITPSRVQRVRTSLPELLEEKHARLTKDLGIDQPTLKALEKTKRLALFQKLQPLAAPAFVAKVLLSADTDVKRHGGHPEKLSDAQYEAVFTALKNGTVVKDSVFQALALLSQGKPLPKAEAIDVDAEVASLLKSKPGLSFGAYMGMLMGKLKGKVSGDDISKALKKAMS